MYECCMQNKLKPFHTDYKLKCPYIYGHSCTCVTDRSDRFSLINK